MARCECGDMPGRCPGPANCPMCEPAKPVCERCDSDQSNVEDRAAAGNPWPRLLCDECYDVEIEDQASEPAEPYFERMARELRGMP